MHQYLLRIPKVLFKRIKLEADARGIFISEMIIQLIEKGLLNIYEKEVKNEKL